MKLYDFGLTVAFILLGTALLFAPNPDIDGDGKPEVICLRDCK